MNNDTRTQYQLTCDACGCESTERRYFDVDGFPVYYCSFHEDHGTDLPCPDCGDHQ